MTRGSDVRTAPEHELVERARLGLVGGLAVARTALVVAVIGAVVWWFWWGLGVKVLAPWYSPYRDGQVVVLLDDAIPNNAAVFYRWSGSKRWWTTKTMTNAFDQRAAVLMPFFTAGTRPSPGDALEISVSRRATGWLAAAPVSRDGVYSLAIDGPGRASIERESSIHASLTRSFRNFWD